MTSSSTGTRPILLAFSGGLDTSFCVPWLADTYGRPIITLTVDTGGIDSEAALQLEERSRALGAVAHHLVDARAGYFDQVLRFLVIGNVRRGNLYPLCVGAERVLQARKGCVGSGYCAQGCAYDAKRYAEECSLVRATLEKRAEPHWKEFLSLWKT